MKWTNEEINVLKEYFPDFGINKCVELLPNRNKKVIKAKIDALKIKSNKYDKWTEEENKIFKEAWENYDMEKLLETFPNRSYQKLMLHASYLGYKSINNRHKKNDMSFLDLEHLTPKNVYWWGFIMADGHIGNRQLIVQLKDIDFLHLKKLSEHLKCNIVLNNNFCRICPEDVKRITKWREIFMMKENAKTYFPPKLTCFEKFFIYFFIGFVDGDGCVWLSKNYPSLKIELHNSWKENLEYFSRILKEKYNIKSVKVYVSSKNTSVLTIENRYDIIEISKYCKDVDYLERKWNKILNYVPIQKRKRSKTYEEYIKNLQELGIYSVKEAQKQNKHIERGAKRFNVSFEKIDNDLKNLIL